MNKQQMAMAVKKRKEEYEQQLEQVRELELKARFWKAQFEIRYYTLEAEDLQARYDDYVAAQKAKNDRAQKEFEEMIKKMQEQGLQVNPTMMDVVVNQETLDANPEMVEEGIKVGDVIQVPDLTKEEQEMIKNG